MNMLAPHIDADKWLFQLFSSKAAVTGGVIRRQVKDIERIVGWARFQQDIRWCKTRSNIGPQKRLHIAVVAE